MQQEKTATGHKEKTLQSENGEELEQAAQRGSGFVFLSGSQNLTGWDPKQQDIASKLALLWVKVAIRLLLEVLYNLNFLFLPVPVNTGKPRNLIKPGSG